jgi:hypothetical protein
MSVCVMCRFPVELDDVTRPAAVSRCICFRCYREAADSVLHFPKRLREELELCLQAVPQNVRP